MQKRFDKVLAVFVALSFLVSVVLMLLYTEIISASFETNPFGWCSRIFPVVPFLFLQLLLCKNAKRKWVQALPLAILAAGALFFSVVFALSGDWGVIGSILTLIYSIAPVVGCGLGFVIYRIWRKQNYKINAERYVQLVIFPLVVLVVGLGVDFYEVRHFNGRAIYDIPAKEAIVAAFDENTCTYTDNELIGYTRGQLHEIWGEPQTMLAGFWGDLWKTGDGTAVIVYYDAGDRIEYVKTDRTSAYDTNRAAVTIDGKIYDVVGESLYFETEEAEEVYEQTESHAIDDYAAPYMAAEPEAGYYFPDMEMDYAVLERGIVVMYGNEWFLCSPRE